jgi:hypothetical protein
MDRNGKNTSGYFAQCSARHRNLRKSSNSNNAQIQANAGSQVFMKGSIYAKWSWFKVAGAGVYQSQFTVGTMTVTGGGQVIIEKYDRNFNMAGFIYLVE